MPSFLTEAARWLSAVSILGAISLAVVLWRQRLHGKYKFFFGFLIFDAARSVVTATLPARSTRQAIVFMVTEPVLSALYFLIVAEIFNKALRNYTGLKTVGRKALWIGLGAGFVAASALWLADFRPESGSAMGNLLRATYVFGRTALTTVSILLLAVALFTSWFPVRLSKNAAACLLGLAVYFVAKTGLTFARNVLGTSATQLLGVANMLVATGCLAYWLSRMRLRNEDVATPVRHVRDPKQAERLVAHLEQINESFEKAIRR